MMTRAVSQPIRRRGRNSASRSPGPCSSRFLLWRRPQACRTAGANRLPATLGPGQCSWRLPSSWPSRSHLLGLGRRKHEAVQAKDIRERIFRRYLSSRLSRAHSRSSMGSVTPSVASVMSFRRRAVLRSESLSKSRKGSRACRTTHVASNASPNASNVFGS